MKTYVWNCYNTIYNIQPNNTKTCILEIEMKQQQQQQPLYKTKLNEWIEEEEEILACQLSHLDQMKEKK